MKNLKKLWILGMITVLAAWFPTMNSAQAQPGARVSFQVFYDQLAPYGDWVRDRELGYIWIPAVHQDFHPYSTDGYWVRTKYGNTWVSDYDWGWAPFHYGRWKYDEYYGWAWVPGYEWGPAWVTWRSGGGYYGWAPMTPSIHIHIPVHQWVFIPQKHIFHHHGHRHYVSYRNMNRVYNHTTIINNTYVYNNNTYYSGPSIRDMERATRSSVSIRQIQYSNSPGRIAVNNKNVRMYRPEIDQSSRTSAKPGRVTDVTQIRGSSSRSSNRESVIGNRVGSDRGSDVRQNNSVRSSNAERSNNSVRSSNTERSNNSVRSSNTERSNNSVRSSNAERNPVRNTQRSNEQNVRNSAAREGVRQTERSQATSRGTLATTPVQQKVQQTKTIENRSNSSRSSTSRSTSNRPNVEGTKSEAKRSQSSRGSERASQSSRTRN